jgi:Protein of unknown function (DUF4232)
VKSVTRVMGLMPSAFMKVLVLIGAGVVLLGCGGGTPTTTTTSTSPPPTTATTIPASSTPTTIGLQACSTGVLSASAVSGGIAAGTGYESFTVTNGAPSSCFVKGYATLELFGPSSAGGAGVGPRLSITVSQTGAAAAQETLRTHGSSSFSMRYSNEPVGGVGCQMVASAELSPPGSTQTLSFPVTLTVCGGSVQIGPFGSPGTQTP